MSEETSTETLPSVSILLPVLNEGKYIRRCLESILKQDYPAEKLEVIVLDGGSSDDTCEQVLAFSSEHNGFCLVENPGRTQAKAFNLGVGKSKGDVVVRLDAHTTYDCDYVRKCVETLRETGAANVGGALRTKPGGEGFFARSVAIVASERFGIGGASFRVGGKAGPVDTVPFGAFTRSVFDQVGLMNELLARGEDNEFNSRLRSAGLTVYFNPVIVCTYYARGTVWGFLKQMFQNGLYHVLTLMVNPRGCSVRHFIPFGFVMALLVCMVGGLFWQPIWWLGGAILGLYTIADMAASALVCLRKGLAYFVILPWLFFLVHMSYGIGTLAGVFRFYVPSLLSRRARINEM